MFILDFFRDFFSGIMYWLYVSLCIFVFFYVLGIVADRKRLAIAIKLKEKKTYDIESGREAQIAAMESKQVLDVDDTLPAVAQTPVQNQTLGQQSMLQNQMVNPVPMINKQEEVPHMVLNSNDAQTTQKQEEPLVISSTPSASTVTPVQNQINHQ